MPPPLRILPLNCACSYHGDRFPKHFQFRIQRDWSPGTMTNSIKRVGVVLKPHQPEALRTMCELTVWLAKRDLTLVGGPEIEREAISRQTGCSVGEVSPEKLAAAVDLVLVLGGDGTMIAASRMVADTEVPVLGINFGGLGYLAEFRIEELYTALESILSGNYRLDKRVMLSVKLPGEAQPIHRVLNDVVINNQRWHGSSKLKLI